MTSLAMMEISAASSAAKTIAKSQKVIFTDSAVTAETAAQVGRISCMVHGWRPTSATIHPASLHIHTTGMESIPIQRATRFSIHPGFL